MKFLNKAVITDNFVQNAVYTWSAFPFSLSSNPGQA